MSSQGRFYLKKGQNPPEVVVIEIPIPLRKTFKRLERDEKIVALYSTGLSLEAVGRRFGLTGNGVAHAIERFPGNKRKINALEPTKRTTALMKQQRFESTVYFNSCPHCRTGAVRLDWLPDHYINILWCINCGFEIAS